MQGESAASSFGLVRSPRTSDLIAEQLREAILISKLRPGERLVEQKLSAQFGVGQPTLREALQTLERQGFVRKNGNRGTYVTNFSEDDVRKNLEVRIVLEALAVQRAAVNLTEKGAQELEQIIQTMQSSAERFERSAFHKADVAFHLALWKLADNAFLFAALERVTFSLFAFMLAERQPLDAVFENVVQQHRDILDGVLTRNPEAAHEAFVKATMDFWQKHHGVQIKQLKPMLL